MVRRKLKQLNVDHGIEVVYSTEKPYQAKLTNSDSSDRKDQYAPLPNFDGYSEAMLPLLIPLPAMFGMTMATFITCKIAGWAMEPFQIRFRMELYQRVHRDLKAREDELSSSTSTSEASPSGTFPLNRRDIGYVVEEMFKSKSGVSGSMDQIAVCRWRCEKPLSLLNAVVLTEKEMAKHLALPQGADLVEVYGKEVVEYVEGRFREEEQISRL